MMLTGTENLIIYNVPLSSLLESRGSEEVNLTSKIFYE